VGRNGGGGEKGGEMTQTLYAHMNKIKILKKKGLVKYLPKLASNFDPRSS
jgi:hypothetical protein